MSSTITAIDDNGAGVFTGSTSRPAAKAVVGELRLAAHQFPGVKAVPLHDSSAVDRDTASSPSRSLIENDLE